MGTKDGDILLYDIASSSLLETIKAHSSTVWSMHVRPDGEALVTGSADKDIKFWEFEREESGSSYILGSIQSLAHVKTLKMTDDVLSVQYSPNGKLLAAALLDSTVKVFYQDTLKFFLSLYGHKVCLETLIGTMKIFLRLIKASSTFNGYLRRFKTHRDLFSGQKHKDLGLRLRRLS